MRVTGPLGLGLSAGALASLLAVAPVLGANEVEKAAKAKKGRYFLKANLPYVSGRHAFGTYKKPLVTCTAEGLRTQGEAEIKGGLFNIEGRTLSLRINDEIAVDDIEYDGDDDQMDIEVQGKGRTQGGSGVVAFRGLRSLAEFEACWNEVFSDLSIEKKYEWPEDVRRLVLDRQVTNGMSREQVLVALGNPDRMSKTTESGQEVEIWVVQMGEGSKMGYFSMKAADRREVAIRFLAGKVASFESNNAGSDLKVK